MRKIKVGIIGTGNIGTDLLIKVQRSPLLKCTLFMGRRYDSIGMNMAQEMGVPVTDRSIEALQADPDCCDIVFDATSANGQRLHAPILKALNKYTIDLTPSLLGRMCIPAINLEECLEADNVNLVTCGGQATVPLAYAMSRVQKVRYFEMVAAIASKSAGPGTRANIDEFTQTTKLALSNMASADKAKAIIIINPADPPILMHNTLYALIDAPDIPLLRRVVAEMEASLQRYVPGYKVIIEPTFENGRVTTMIQVEGMGDYLPTYAGNLDVITCAALHVAEAYAEKHHG